jgi:glycosyltransferase involved in cell wall biosynthesis
MRIALVADEDPGWGGIGTYTGVLGVALRDLGHEVHLVLRGWEDDCVEELDSLTVHRVTVPGPTWRRGTVAAVSRLFVARESVIFSVRVARALARIGPDVAEAPEFHAAGLVAALRARLDRGAAPVVTRLHTPSFLTSRLDGESPDMDVRAGEVLEAAGAQCARLVTSPSQALAHVVCRRWRLAPRRVRVVPNPVDEDLFAPVAEDAEMPGRILVVGRVERLKGQHVLLEALPSIREAVPEAHVSLVGDDGGSVKLLERRARELRVSDAVRFEGVRAREDLPSAYRSASVCVVPSRFENFPYSCVEAMSCGRPVVASRGGGLPEAITDESNGLLVAPEDPAALGDAIRRLLLDEPERRRLGKAARARVLSSFSRRSVAGQMAELYEEIAR